MPTRTPRAPAEAHRDPAEAHAGALRDGGAEQQAEDYCHEGVVEQDEGSAILTKVGSAESCGGLVGSGHAKNWLLGCGTAFARVALILRAVNRSIALCKNAAS